MILKFPRCTCRVQSTWRSWIQLWGPCRWFLMEIKRHAVVIWFCSILLLSVLRVFEPMAFSTPLRVLTYSLLASFWANVWANTQVVLPCSNRTAINGTPFPSLIDTTTEDLISGLESGLFTSVDLVNAYVARIMEVRQGSTGPIVDSGSHERPFIAGTSLEPG